jgi:hypothetical protein
MRRQPNKHTKKEDNKKKKARKERETRHGEH